MKRIVVAFVVVAAVLLTGGVAWAGWGVTGTGAGSSRAVVMPSGSGPTATVVGRNVTVSWSASSFPDSTPVNGYRVTRYDSVSASQSVGSSCSGTINALTCVEAAVPPGTWTYAVVPKQFGWTGMESSTSASVVVGSPSFSFSSSTSLTSLPVTLAGSLQNFVTGETVVYRLDNASSGTLLTGSITPNPVQTAGTATVSVTIPAAVSIGSHTVFAVGSQGSTASASISVGDTTAPSVTAAAIGKTTGGSGGFIKQGGTFYVYANVVDPSPASGLSIVTANVNTITTLGTAVLMTPGSYTLDGVAYNYRSASRTARNPLSAGTMSFSITVTDLALNTATQGGFSVTVDNTVPWASDVQTANGGGTAGKAEAGDTAVFTFSEPMEPISLLAGWSGASTAVTVRLVNNATGDRIQIWNAANTAQLPFGTIRLGRTDYIASGTVRFTGSTMVLSGSAITVTLGAPSGAVGTAAGSGLVTWAASSTSTDRAGNACSTATATESGAADMEF